MECVKPSSLGPGAATAEVLRQGPRLPHAGADHPAGDGRREGRVQGPRAPRRRAHVPRLLHQRDEVLPGAARTRKRAQGTDGEGDCKRYGNFPCRFELFNYFFASPANTYSPL